jgi:hypothetical protein
MGLRAAFFSMEARKLLGLETTIREQTTLVIDGSAAKRPAQVGQANKSPARYPGRARFSSFNFVNNLACAEAAELLSARAQDQALSLCISASEISKLA